MKFPTQETPKESALIDLMQYGPERAWINLKGDSMTSEEGLSLPSGSKILIKRLPQDPIGIPVNKPVALMGIYNGESFSICKLITFIDLVSNRVKCESLNRKYLPFWLNLDYVKAVFEIEQFDYLGKTTKLT